MTNDTMEFVVKALGGTSKRAFDMSQASRLKPDFITVELPQDQDPYEYAAELINKKDKRVSDGDGPAGCIDITGTTYGILEEPGDDERVFLFFGWAHY